MNKFRVNNELRLCVARFVHNKLGVDVETHTGQKWDGADPRNSRFTDKQKTVNKNWGQKLIDEVEPLETPHRVVCCDGGDEETGHPRVFINLDKKGVHTCRYCGLRFCKIHRQPLEIATSAPPNRSSFFLPNCRESD